MIKPVLAVPEPTFKFVLNVFSPAISCDPVVMAPEAVALADGIAAPVPVDEFTVGPAVVPAVHDKFVPAGAVYPKSSNVSILVAIDVT